MPNDTALYDDAESYNDVVFLEDRGQCFALIDYDTGETLVTLYDDSGMLP